VLLPGRRLRQGRLARGCDGLPPGVPPPRPPGRPRTVTLRTRRARLVLLRGGPAGLPGPQAGFPRPHGDDGGSTGHWPGFVRPSVSEPGHDAARRIRKPDRLAAAERGPRAGEQRLPRRQPHAVARPMGLSREHAQDWSIARGEPGPGSRAARPRPGRPVAATGRWRRGALDGAAIAAAKGVADRR